MCSSLVVINHLQKIVMIILAWWERAGERAHAGIGADIVLDRELSGLNCSVDLVHFHFVLLAYDHIYLLFIFEARRALWSPRSVGPYGLGRAPSPLMHAPVGHAYGCPAGAPIIGRDFYFLISRTSTRLRLVPGSNAPLRGAYGYPYGVPIIMGHPLGCPICAPFGCTL